MNNVEYAFSRAFKKRDAKDWDYIFVAVDIHDCIFEGQYRSDDYNIDAKYYPDALIALDMLSMRDDIKLIMWSASSPDYMHDVDRHLVENHYIFFDYHNENPEVVGDSLIDVSRKMYFDVVLDDKAGFNANTDWTKLVEFLEENQELMTCGICNQLYTDDIDCKCNEWSMR